LCFFFQAEDGIRDKLVTGVQTCALPISGVYVRATEICVLTRVQANRQSFIRNAVGPAALGSYAVRTRSGQAASQEADSLDELRRSEERRVGKECRARWEAGHCKQKKGEA